MSRFLTIYLFIFVGFISQQEIFVKGADVYWRDYEGTIPSDAYSTGYNTYIAQVVYNNSLMTGTFYPSKKIVVAEYDGKKEFDDNFKLLCTSEPQSLQWEAVNMGELDHEFLHQCIIGGHQADGKLYIGKIYHENEWKIGKVVPPTSIYNNLYVWWNNGGTYVSQDFEILMTV
ncbi:uncharacterized protein [Onthophagus taurus]|uniref:uncharacterized protein n=1 Tax=Onthophagus taurus TaxID=166361 RepID=UPI0039BE237F